MIRRLDALGPCRDFVDALWTDPVSSTAFMKDREDFYQRLESAFTKKDRLVFGVFRGAEPIGLFAFLHIEEDHYLEMTAALSRSADAVREMLSFLEEQYPGYHADFVFHPKNRYLKEALAEKGADLAVEQMRMRLRQAPAGEAAPSSVISADIALLSDDYLPQYCALHNQDVYWTGEKVAEAPERFRTFLALDRKQVVGYLDITYRDDENNIFDLLVAEDHRRRGFGRKLLAAAIEMNRPHGMTLEVDVDNAPAIALYRSMGFQPIPDQNTQTAGWDIPAARSVLAGLNRM